MPVFSEIPIPPEVDALFESARKGEINPVQFYKALKELDDFGVAAMFYIAKAFDLPLESAKRIVIQQEYGSVEAWAEPIIESLSELDREDEQSS